MKKTIIAIMLSTSLIGGIGATIGSKTVEAATLKAKRGFITTIVKDNVKDSEVLNLSSDCGVYQRRVIFKKYFGCINGQTINIYKPICNGGIIIGNGSNSNNENDSNIGNDNNNNTENKDEINNNNNNNNASNGDISTIVPPTQTEKPSTDKDTSIDEKPSIEQKPNIEQKPSVDEKPSEEIKPSPENNSNLGEVNDKFMTQVENLIYEKVNEERTKAGLETLSYNTTMEKYARIKSQDMGDNNYFSHEDLSGNLITTQMKNDGVTYRAWGENIAYIGGVSDANALAEQFMTNWMNSQGHRENILSSKFSSIGVGVYKIGNKVYATQEFYK